MLSTAVPELATASERDKALWALRRAQREVLLAAHLLEHNATADGKALAHAIEAASYAGSLCVDATWHLERALSRNAD